MTEGRLTTLVDQELFLQQGKEWGSRSRNQVIFAPTLIETIEIFCFRPTLCLKKVPTFKLSVTLSNLNRFSKLLHYWKAYEICYKTHTTLPTSP